MDNESTIGKSASRIWREQTKSNQTTLPFDAWITREKERLAADGFNNNNLLMVDRTLNDSVHAAINDAAASGGLNKKPSGNTVFGINKTVFILGAVLLAASSIYLMTQIRKK